MASSLEEVGRRPEGRYAMKFLIAVLSIRFLIELVSNKKNEIEISEENENSARTIHPAEYLLR